MEREQPAPVAATAPAPTPEPFGKYYLLDRIATGGMAEVFRAKLFSVGGFEKFVVVKRILTRYAEDPAFVEMFIDEARLSAQLVHPNIAQIFDFGKLGSNWFIAMEAVPGKDLKSLLRRLAERRERMPVELAAGIAHEIARGLEYAHTRVDGSGQPLRIVHRDVSPSNVLLSYEGGVKLVDFGIARAEGHRAVEEDGQLKGKFRYMSPEQTTGGALDHRSDQFAAGICLWEMLTGNRLFRGDDDDATLDAIRNAEAPKPSSYNPAVPEGLDAICMRALAKDPAQRYADCGEFARELQDFLLPLTPERLRPRFADLLIERFQPEIADERARLDRSTKVAADLHYGGEVDLDLEAEHESAASPGHAQTLGKREAPARGLRPIWGAVIGLLVVAAAAFGMLAGNEVAPVQQAASLTVSVLPTGLVGAALTLDGVPIGDGPVAVEPNLPHELRATAPGHGTRSRTVELVPGQSLAVEIVLQPEAVPDVKPAATAPKAAPPKADAPAVAPRVAFRTEPGGAKVFVDGKPVGETPLDWTGGSAGKAVNVEFRLGGYQSAQAALDVPASGGSVEVARTLAPKPSDEPGRLTVQATPGWAKVYIDGAYVNTTPLHEHPLPPGVHTVRVVNDRQGIDKTEEVTVRPGETARRTFRLDE